MAQNLIFFVEREKKRKQPAISEAVSQLMTAFTGGMQASMPPLQQPTPPPQQSLPLFLQQLPPSQHATLSPMLAVLPQQPIAEPPPTKVMDMDMGAVEVGQSDEQMTDGSGVQELGS